MTEKIANRLRIPKACQQVAALVSRHQDELSRATTLNAKELLQFIDSLDAKRRPDRLEKFFLACKANVTSSENDPGSFLTQTELIRVLIKKINDINWKTLLADQNDTNREIFITAKKLSIVSDHIAQHA